MNNSEVRGRPAVSTVEPGTAFRQKFRAKNQSGMTLVEVLLGAAILGIMAVVVVNALFYPRLLAVSSLLKQQAVHAGTDAMERVFSRSYDAITNGTVTVNPGGSYAVNGFKIPSFPMTVTLGPGANPDYKLIKVTVSYPGGENPVVLETRRYNVN